MLDHVSLGVSNLEHSRQFYDVVLGVLGLIRIDDFEGRGSDYGTALGSPNCLFTITREEGNLVARGMHVCFRARDRETVRRFHETALGAGGLDEGPPGPRLHYHADYYGAFVIDPDGHRIEAVCHVRPPL